MRKKKEHIAWGVFSRGRLVKANYGRRMFVFLDEAGAEYAVQVRKTIDPSSKFKVARVRIVAED